MDNQTLIQAFSLLGAFLQLLVYALMQTNRIKPESYFYQSFNTIGSFIMFSVSIQLNSWGFALMEGSWMCISAYGWYKTYKQNKGKL
jgi:uncharacterized membrane protein